MRVAYDEMHALLVKVLRQEGFEPERADLSARLFAESPFLPLQFLLSYCLVATF